MDSVLGARGDSARVLTLLHRPTRFQLALPLADGTRSEVLAALRGLSAPLGGPAGAHRVFGLALTDNGPEFSDEGAIASLLGERPGETRLFYCDPRRADQKGACERNHVELRKLLPKGASMEGLTAAGLAEAMSMLNSEPRPALGGALPIRLFRAALGEDAEALLAALGVREVPYGELLMSPAAVGRAGGRGAGPGHRAGTQPRPARGPVALAPEPGAAGGRSAPPGPARRRGHDPSTSENGGGRDLRRPSRRRAGCGNPDSGQTVSLTLLINLK